MSNKLDAMDFPSRNNSIRKTTSSSLRKEGYSELLSIRSIAGYLRASDNDLDNPKMLLY